MVALQSEQAGGYGIQVLDRVFRILEALADRPARVPALSSQLGLHRATVFRLLVNLERHGYVRRDDLTGVYSLGLELFRLGSKALEEQFPVQRLRPLLQGLTFATGHTAQLWLRSGHEALCADQVESPGDLRVVGRIGRRLPLNSGAVGKVLLAFAPEAVVDAFLSGPLSRVSPRTVAEPELLRAELGAIQAQGWAQSEGETRVRSWAVAAPVYNALGAVEVCVCILAVENELPAATLELARQEVARTAGEMSHVLGYDVEPTSTSPLVATNRRV
jgi:DNA-binding IclR family transcriptional regulator